MQYRARSVRNSNWPFATAGEALVRLSSFSVSAIRTTRDDAVEPRRGYYLDVETWYHLQVFIPLLQQFLPDDPLKGSPWIRLPGRITVVVN